MTDAATVIYLSGFVFCLYRAWDQPSNWPHDLGYASAALYWPVTFFGAFFYVMGREFIRTIKR